MTARGQVEGQIGLEERSQYFQVGIILEIRQLHTDRIARTRTKGQEGEGKEAVDPLCSRNARSRTPLVGRAQSRIDQATLEKQVGMERAGAVGDSSGHHRTTYTSELGGSIIETWSLDARRGRPPASPVWPSRSSSMSHTSRASICRRFIFNAYAKYHIGSTRLER